MWVGVRRYEGTRGVGTLAGGRYVGEGGVGTVGGGFKYVGGSFLGGGAGSQMGSNFLKLTSSP